MIIKVANLKKSWQLKGLKSLQEGLFYLIYNRGNNRNIIPAKLPVMGHVRVVRMTQETGEQQLLRTLFS